MNKFILVLVLFFCYELSFGQSKVTYCQSDAGPYATNCYTLNKLNAKSSKGTFEQMMDFDDGQRLYGKGTFTEYRNTIILDKYTLIKKQYNLKGDSVLKCDTSVIQRRVFYKKGNALISYSLNPKTKVRVETTFPLSK